MASLENLPADQRAVLQLVLQRGRSYDEIGRLLSIDPGAVRQRATSALSELGPETGLAEDRRQLVTDYLLGQLDSGAAQAARDGIAASAGERAWARVVASELGPLAGSPLPEIPAASASATPHPTAGPVAADTPPSSGSGVPEPAVTTEPASGRRPRLGRRRGAAVAGATALDTTAPAAAAEPKVPKAPRDPEDGDDGGQRSSRLGGAVLIALTVLIVAAVVIIFVSQNNSGATKAASHTTSTPAAPAATPAPAAAGTTTATTSSAAKVIAQINLTPTSAGGKAAGIAEILKEGVSDGIAIVAQHVTPNTTKPPNAYAVWLYNSAGDAHILGFVNPGVGSNGRLSTAGGLPTNASRYKQLIVTVETKATPKKPGTILLQGKLTGL